MFTTDNFYMNTAADFAPCAAPDRLPDYVSASGSEYWYEPEGVVRRANHWGGVASCEWTLDGECLDGRSGRLSGFCPWGGFAVNHDDLDVTVYGVDPADAEAVTMEGMTYVSVPVTPEICRGGRVHTPWGSVALRWDFFMSISL